MTADGWAAMGVVICTVVGSWVRSAVKTAQIEQRLTSVEDRQQDHGNSFAEFRDAIADLTRVVDRLATIEEMRSRREANRG